MATPPTPAPYSHIAHALHVSQLNVPSWPINPDVWSVSGRGIGLWSAGGAALGTVLGVMGDTGVGSFALTTAFNTATMGCVFFGSRELVFSPLLLKAGWTADHRRRMMLVTREANKGKHGLPPLKPESWTEIRSKRIADSALAGAFTATLGPAIYRKLLGYGGFKIIKPTLSVIAFTTVASSTVSAGVQWLFNESKIYQLKMYGAYDEFGPIPEVDIHSVREKQRQEIYQALTVRQKQAYDETNAIAAGDLAGQVEKKKEKKLPWWSIRRFAKESLPFYTTLTPEEYLKRQMDQREKWIDELRDVREQLKELGEHEIDELDEMEMARLTKPSI